MCCSTSCHLNRWFSHLPSKEGSGRKGLRLMPICNPGGQQIAPCLKRQDFAQFISKNLVRLSLAAKDRFAIREASNSNNSNLDVVY